MSWKHGDEEDEFIVHDTPAPNREKVLENLRLEIIELSWHKAIAKKLGIENSSAQRERKIYIDRAKAVAKVMEGEKANVDANPVLQES